MKNNNIVIASVAKQSSGDILDYFVGYASSQ